MMDQTIDDLLAIMTRLRDPEHGCPWDLKQSFRTIPPYTLEEAYKVAEAIGQIIWTTCATSSGTFCVYRRRGQLGA